MNSPEQKAHAARLSEFLAEIEKDAEARAMQHSPDPRDRRMYENAYTIGASLQMLRWTCELLGGTPPPRPHLRK